MNVKQIANKLGFTHVAGEKSILKDVTGVFCCDLLSFVIGRAPSCCIWLTVIGNSNSIAVASLADISCILLCEGVDMDEDGLAKAKEHDIAVYKCNEPIYETAIKLSELSL